jgi:hypothetical protein
LRLFVSFGVWEGFGGDDGFLFTVREHSRGPEVALGK